MVKYMAFILASKTRSNILAFFFTHADERYYVRELASLTNEDAGNLSRELRRLEAEGICSSSRKGRIKFYSLNKNYPLYSDLKSILFKTAGLEGSLRRLVEDYEGIEEAIMHGSFARGIEKQSSDVDLVIIGKFDRDKFTGQLRGLESKLKRDINFTVYTRQEFNKEMEKRGSFLNIIMSGKKIQLKARNGK